MPGMQLKSSGSPAEPARRPAPHKRSGPLDGRHQTAAPRMPNGHQNKTTVLNMCCPRGTDAERCRNSAEMLVPHALSLATRAASKQAAAGSSRPQRCVQPQDLLQTGRQPCMCAVHDQRARNAWNAAQIERITGRACPEACTAQAERPAGWPAPDGGAKNAEWPPEQDNGTEYVLSPMH